MKKGQVEVIQGMKNGDKGFTAPAQVNYQEFVRNYGLGVELGDRTMTRQKSVYDDALSRNDYSGMLYCVIEFDRTPDLLCSGTSIVELDFEGRAYHQLGNPNIEQEVVTFSLIPTERGGAAIFVSMDRGGIARSFLQSVLRIPAGQVANAMVRYASEFFENTFYAPAWWESLNTHKRDTVLARAGSGAKPFDVRDASCLTDDGVDYVSWQVTTVTHNE